MTTVQRDDPADTAGPESAAEAIATDAAAETAASSPETTAVVGAAPLEAAWIESERGRPLQTKSARQVAVVEALFGRRFRAVVPSDEEWRALLQPDDAGRVVAALATGRETGVYDTTYRIVLPDGRLRRLHDRVLLLADRWQLRIVSTLDAHVEPTGGADGEESIRSRGARDDRWLDAALGEAILRCDHAGRVTDLRGPAELLPIPADALRGHGIADFVSLPLAMRQAWSTALDRALETRRAQICAYSLDRDGVTRAFEARVLPLESGAAVAIRDVGERNLLRERVERHADSDELTGLGNLRSLRERLDRWMRPGAAPAPVAVLIVDLDRFKQTSDLHGRSIGDSLLRLVAQRLRRVGRRELQGRPLDGTEVALPAGRGESNDSNGDDEALATVRVGGDQFAVAWRVGGTDAAASAAGLAGRLIAALAAPTRIAGQTVFVRASIGGATFPRDARDAATLFAQAEAALRRAKAAGRNQYRHHGDDGAGTVAASGPPATDAALRAALASDQFLLVYQPKFELASSLSPVDADGPQAGEHGALQPGAIVAVEALVRWRTPSGRLLIPHEFIPLAESSGTIRPLGEWVLRTALAEVATFAARGAARVGVAINVSLLQLHDRAFVLAVESALRDTGFAARELTIELTEAAFVEDFRLAADALAELSALGVRLAVDHFGTGTAGLVALKSLPIDEIKIDRSFIAGAAIDAFDATIVAGLIGIAHDLGKTVTAEGVERIDQIGSLRQMRCDNIQGYFVGEPMTADALVADAALWRTTRARPGTDAR